MATHSSIGLPYDGPGKQLHTIQNSDNSHTQSFTLADPENHMYHQFVDPYGAAYVRFSEGNQIFDSFGKSKMSQETMVGEYIPRYGLQGRAIQTKNTGGGSATWLPNEGAIRLQTGTTQGDSVQRTTNKYHRYYLGTSQLCMFTIVLGDYGKDGVTRQWGYYDDYNGIIFRVDGFGSFKIVVRTSTSGSVVETEIPQSEFNADKGDGTGVSGLALDPSKDQIYWIDFQWLGAGRIRIGAFHPNGSRITIHQIENANALPTSWMSTGSLPLRWEQFNHGTPVSTSEMKIFNAAVFSENAQLDYTGNCHSSANFTAPITPKLGNADGTFKEFVSIRPKATFKGLINRSAIIPKYLMVQTDKPIQISIYKNLVFNGTETWVSVDDNSVVEKSGNIVMTDWGTDQSVYCGLVDTGTHSIDLSHGFHYLREYLKLNADETQPTYTIIFRAIDGTAATVVAGLTWTELKI